MKSKVKMEFRFPNPTNDFLFFKAVYQIQLALIFGSQWLRACTYIVHAYSYVCIFDCRDGDALLAYRNLDSIEEISYEGHLSSDDFLDRLSATSASGNQIFRSAGALSSFSKFVKG